MLCNKSDAYAIDYTKIETIPICRYTSPQSRPKVIKTSAPNASVQMQESDCGGTRTVTVLLEM